MLKKSHASCRHMRAKVCQQMLELADGGASIGSPRDVLLTPEHAESVPELRQCAEM